MMGAPVATEHAEQVAVMQWWERYARTKGIDSRLLFAIPNAQKFMSKARNIHAAYSHAVAEGLREGVPDLFLAVPMLYQDRATCGLFLEMKRMRESKVSAEQKDMHEMLRRKGYFVQICYGAPDALLIIQDYLD